MATPKALLERLIAQGAVLFGRFKLTSGAESPYYVDIKRATTDPVTLRMVGELLAPEARKTDLVGGMALGAVPIAVAAGLAAEKPFVVVRKEERTHGTGKRIEGPDVKGKRILVVEDVATSGGSVLQAVQVLKAAGAIVTDAWVVVDREQGAAAALRAEGVTLHGLVSASDLLKRVDNAPRA